MTGPQKHIQIQSHSAGEKVKAMALTHSIMGSPTGMATGDMFQRGNWREVRGVGTLLTPPPCGYSRLQRPRINSYCKPGCTGVISNSVRLTDVGAAGGGGSGFQGYKMVPNTSYCLARRKTQR